MNTKLIIPVCILCGPAIARSEPPEVAPTTAEELTMLCSTDQGLEKIAAEELLVKKFDHYQAAAIRAQGGDPDKIYQDSIIAKCAELTGVVEGSAGTVSFGFDPDKPMPFVTPFHFPEGFGCSASWDKKCDGEERFQVPAGYQACGITFEWKTEGDEARFSEPPVPILFYNGDEEEPPRFRGYKIRYKAAGNGQPLNPMKAKVRISNVYLFAIDSSWDNAARYRVGCEIPEGDGGGQISIPPI